MHTLEKNSNFGSMKKFVHSLRHPTMRDVVENGYERLIKYLFYGD